MKQNFSHWLPAGFCSVLSLISLVAAVYGARWGSSPGPWVPGFLCFLPMCFFDVALVTLRMQREIGELRKRIDDLQANQTS